MGTGLDAVEKVMETSNEVELKFNSLPWVPQVETGASSAAVNPFAKVALE